MQSDGVNLWFLITTIWYLRIHSLKYLRSTTSGRNDIEVRKSELLAKTQFLYWPIGSTLKFHNHLSFVYFTKSLFVASDIKYFLKLQSALISNFKRNNWLNSDFCESKTYYIKVHPVCINIFSVTFLSKIQHESKLSQRLYTLILKMYIQTGKYNNRKYEKELQGSLSKC